MPSGPELSLEFRRALEARFDAGQLALDQASCVSYGYDNSRRSQPAQGVLFARTAEDVRVLVELCARHRVPVIARGRGTNTTGATVPVAGGIVLSLERMNRILEINADDRLARVEPGVLNGDLQQALLASGLFWPPDPTSAGFASIGGNLACNAGGPRAVKYGACRDNVLGLVAIDGRGRLLSTGTRTSKGATGYDLTRLLIGSEGTLAVIVEATLKLTPKPAQTILLRALFDQVEHAAQAVIRIMRQPHVPSALEFMDGACIGLARRIGGADLPDAGALLMVEADGQGVALAAAADALSEALQGAGLLDLQRADDARQRDVLWQARKALSPALRTIAPNKINEDVVVPVSALPALVQAAEGWSREAGFPVVCFGHAGNGNLHVNLLFDPAVVGQREAANRVLRQLFERVIALGGTLSGEHGIGLDKRDFMTMAIAAETLAAMRDLKALFDPAGILNPGKLLPP